MAQDGLNVTDLAVGFDAVSAEVLRSIQAIQRLSVNIVAVSMSDNTVISELFAQAESHGLLSPGRTWVLLERPFLPAPASLPQGVFVISSAEATISNITAFQTLLGGLDPVAYPGTGPGAPMQVGSLLAYDAVQVVASAILASTTPTRASIVQKLSLLSYSGFSGPISFFSSNGSRVVQFAEILTSNVTGDGYNLTMQYDGTSITVLEPPMFPGATYTVPDDQVDFLQVVTIWSLTGSVFTPISSPWAKNTILYAAQWANNIPGLLPPKTKLDMTVMDDTALPSVAVKYASSVVNSGPVAVIGGMTAALCISMQGALSASEIPLISSGISSAVLSDKVLYPTFMRLVPSSDPEGIATISLAIQFGWTDLTVISTTDTAGTSVTQAALNEAIARGINIDNHFIIQPGLSSYDELMAQLKAAQPAPRVIVFMVSYETTGPLWRSLYNAGIQPVASIVIDTFPADITLAEYVPDIPTSFFEGWVLLGPPSGTGQMYADFVSNVTTIPYADDPGVAILAPALPSLFDTVLVIASSVKTIIEAGGDPRNGTHFLRTMLAYNGVGLSGGISFTPEGDRTPSFDVRNIVNGVQVPVGRWTSAGLSLLPSTAIVWPDGTTNIPLSALPRTMNWLKWKSGAGIALSILAVLGMVMATVMLAFFWYYRGSPVIKSSTWEFLILMLVGVIMGFGSALVWIGQPTQWICALRIWIPPMSFLLILAPLIAKTWRLHRIFTISDLGVKPITLSTLIAMVVVLISLQAVICIFWVSMGTIQPVTLNDPSDRTMAYILCGSKRGNHISSYVTYSYIGLIVIVGCYLAFRVRKLPKDFNESKWIARSIYNIFLFAGLIILLSYALAKYYVVVLILISVCTLAICYGSLILMLAPKLWTLYRNPEKRSSSSGRSNLSSREMKTKTGSNKLTH